MFWQKGNLRTKYCVSEYYRCLAPLLQTQINLYPNMDKKLHQLLSVRRNDLAIYKLQRCNCWILGIDKWFHPTLYCTCDYLSMLELHLIHVRVHVKSMLKETTGTISQTSPVNCNGLTSCAYTLLTCNYNWNISCDLPTWNSIVIRYFGLKC